MSHTIHPPILAAGLCDYCPDCVAKTRDPLSTLDDANLGTLWQRMLDVEFRDHPNIRYRSRAEASVCSEMLVWARFLKRLGIDPLEVAV